MSPRDPTPQVLTPEVLDLSLADLAAGALALLVPEALAQEPALAWLASPLAPGDGPAALQLVQQAAPPADRALLMAARRLGLGPAELLACALARAAELDPLWPAALAALQAPQPHRAGPPRPTLGLVARCASALGWGDDPVALAAALLDGAALASGLLLLEPDDSLPCSQRTLALHPQLLPLLLPPPEQPVQARPARFGSLNVRLLGPASAAPADPLPLPASWQQALQQHARLLGAQPPAVAQLVIRAGLASEAAEVAGRLAPLLGRPVARIEGWVCGPDGRGGSRNAQAEAGGWRSHLTGQLSVQADDALPPGLSAWLALTGALPLFVIDAAPGERVQLPAPDGPPTPLLIAMGHDGDVAAAAHGATRQWRLELPPPAERAALWRAALGPAGRDLDHAALGRRHACGLGTVAAAAAAALSRAAADEPDAEADNAPEARTGPRIDPDADTPRLHLLTEAHLAAAQCEDLTATTHGLSALAQWVPCRGIDSAFVADRRVQQELALALARCRWREQGAQALGPALRTRQGAGVKLLFVGASGTGKTLAAQWLAEQLGKPLYRVDLATVTSKYIGETEKHLAQLLARAEQLDCVLLFDEADALFGARTEVRQANDRFANTQTNYLLQRIEGCTGISVLTSNSKARFDEAFMRRLDQVIDFPLPRGGARTALWRTHLGEAHDLSEAQLARLGSEIDLPGGHIRNIALTALLLAAQEAEASAPQQAAAPPRIAFRHLQAAAALEYAKLGRALSDSLAQAAD